MAKTRLNRRQPLSGFEVGTACQIGHGDSPVTVNEGDILCVVGFPYDRGSDKHRMKVVVFSGETREQIGECFADLDTAVEGKGAFGADHKPDVPENEKAVRGPDGRYTFPQAETLEEMQARQSRRRDGIESMARAFADSEDARDYQRVVTQPPAADGQLEESRDLARRFATFIIKGGS